MERSGRDIYVAGVKRAIHEGILHLEPSFLRNPIPDGFSHLDVFYRGNTRLLHPATQVLLSNVPEGGSVLDIGAGAGVSAFMAHRQRPDLSIHSAGLTPINPYLGFRMANLERVQQGALDGEAWILGQAIFAHSMAREMPFQDLTSGAGEFFTALERPFIHQQFIGDFLKQDGLGSYHLAWDMCGPIHHAHPEERIIAILRHTFSHLLPNGALLLSGAKHSLKFRALTSSSSYIRLLDRDIGDHST